jgi:hypothetical protein
MRSAACGRELPFAFALVHSPLFGAKQPFKKRHLNGYESRLSAKSS